MNLIERYVHAVSKALPENQREDVAQELRGLIDDMLDEKGDRSKKAVESVLLELGNPSTLAAQYANRPQYIIGPDLYPLFVAAVKFALQIGLPIAFVVAFLAQIATNNDTFITFLLSVFGITVAAAFQIVFWTALVFFIMERSGLKKKDLGPEAEWSLDMLPEAPAGKQISLSGAVVEMVWYAIVAALPLLNIRFIGAHQDSSVIPLFNLFPWDTASIVITSIGIAGLVLTTWKLFARKWNVGLAYTSLLFTVATSLILAYVAAAGVMINPDFIAFVDAHTANTTVEQLTTGFYWLMIVIVLSSAIPSVYEEIKHVKVSLRK